MNRHSCGSRKPESLQETGFRIKCGMTSRQLRSTQGAFTLIELLVVIA
ncbi:MAG: type II secretion system protein, partial [Candidatus Aminicenantes bacterium]|nr:type II secretion system protein [Candidatus Aminicenantes bacterium]